MAFPLVLGAVLGAVPAASAASTSEVRAFDDGNAVTCRLDPGPYQLQVEKYLGLPQDGKQSESDCAAIQRMQQKYEIDPADGYAGLVSYRAAIVEWATTHKASLTGCPKRSQLVVCIDQARQLLWLQKAGKITFGPVPARTGMPGHRTRNGSHPIYKRVQKFWSHLYDGPIPYSQFFDGGQALHASYRPIFEDPGSHGCVNLRYDDAKALWSILRLGDSVYVWGTRQGA
ncbi:L,D-transpeptidase [Streptomyces sp. TP-A0356]|uniref:L,D-transpeptidase n=1 Tax=Streptomyces sp. TP-A0356 TaxID=1359208 RepID=UPI0007C7C269|nr:L,D-transpeptidase [Streptomyces sp. TP-A0356]